MFPYMLKIELGSSGSSQSGDRAHEVAMLGDGVDYYHDGIFPFGFRDFDYKIDTGHVPRCIWNWEEMQFSGWWLANGLSPETHVASRDILAYIPGHLWPPVILQDQFQSLPPSRVSCKFQVMTEGQDLLGDKSNGTSQP